MKRDLATALALIPGARTALPVIDEDRHPIDMGGYYNLLAGLPRIAPRMPATCAISNPGDGDDDGV